MSQTDHAPETFSATGTVGLDHILNGGFTPNRLYLIEGDPGAGKTTLAICYLLEGAKHGEPGMYLTLSCVFELQMHGRGARATRGEQARASQLNWDETTTVSKRLQSGDRAPNPSTRPAAVSSRPRPMR